LHRAYLTRKFYKDDKTVSGLQVVVGRSREIIGGVLVRILDAELDRGLADAFVQLNAPVPPRPSAGPAGERAVG